MAKRKAKVRRSGLRASAAKRQARRNKRRIVKRRPARKSVKSAKRAQARRAKPARPVHAKPARLDRKRRTLDDTVAATPPSSLDMDRRGSAVRTGRRELSDSLKEHAGMTPALTGGDVDADWENAYFSGDEAPGGDNPTPDQDVVEDIGKSLGVEYQDSEELKSTDKVTERDKHRWELDPASAEDYKDRS